MSDPLIKVEGVSKKFCRSLKRSLWYGMQDLGSEILGRQHGNNGELRPDEFWAVNNVSFELTRGECLGLIGLNGAGKTTLLKMLNGLIKPDQGRIEMRGRIGALIALGAGFNPILTGRENIYVNASVLGLSKREINEKIDEIIDFAEIGEFIDTPVQNYSSGMQVRLGFAVAVNLNPDVLLIDEVLAVGDVAFRQRAYTRIHELIKKSAVIFVSHSAPQITKVSTRALLLSNGAPVIDSENVGDVLDCYFSRVKTDKKCAISGRLANMLVDMSITTEEANDIFRNCQKIRSDLLEIAYGSRIVFKFKFDISNTYKYYIVAIEFVDIEMKIVAQSISFNNNAVFETSSESANSIEMRIPSLSLNRGIYSINLRVNEVSGTLNPKIVLPLALYESLIDIRIVGNKLITGAAPVQFEAEWSVI